MQSTILRVQLETTLGKRIPTPFTDLNRRVHKTVSSGIDVIDTWTGGLPRGAITEIYGLPSSGKTSMMLSILAAATGREEACALVDGNDAFSPESGAIAGIDLRRLLWVRCHNLDQTMKVTDLLLQSGGFGIVAIDVSDLPAAPIRSVPLSTWFRFQRSIEKTPTILAIVSQDGVAKTCAALAIQTGGDFCLPTSDCAVNAEIVRCQSIRVPKHAIRDFPMYASIFIPHFQVQSLVRNEPELWGRALAVVDGVAPVLKVVEANTAAFQAGVELGMAQLKVKLFFDVAIRQRSQVQEHSAHAAMLDCANAFSPRVEDTAADTVVIDLEGLDRLFGSYRKIVARIYEQMIPIGLQPNVAVAANPDTAIHAARGFQGITVVPRGTERKRLAALPLEVLRPEPEFLDTLHRWGIRTFGAFAELPSIKISERLGQDGLQLHKMARAAETRPLNPYKESLRFEETMELDHAIAHLEPLTFVLSRLLDQICRRLCIRNRATHEVRVQLILDERGAPPHQRVLKLPLPVGDSKLLLKLLMLDLESHPPEAAVTKIRVEAIPTRPRTVQNGLFVTLAPEPEKLELTLARIAHVVGKDVGSPEVSDTHRPDAFRIHRFSSEGIKKDLAGLRPPLLKGGDFRSMVPTSEIPSFEERWPKAGEVFLAFRQFRPALEATVQLRNGTPAWIAFHGLFGPIPTASGPWNSSGDWWREDRWDREEWDIGIESSTKGFGLYRIYRDCPSNRWFTEGIYD